MPFNPIDIETSWRLLQSHASSTDPFVDFVYPERGVEGVQAILCVANNDEVAKRSKFDEHFECVFRAGHVLLLLKNNLPRARSIGIALRVEGVDRDIKFRLRDGDSSYYTSIDHLRPSMSKFVRQTPALHPVKLTLDHSEEHVAVKVIARLFVSDRGNAFIQDLAASGAGNKTKFQRLARVTENVLDAELRI